MFSAGVEHDALPVPTYLLCHEHAAADCRVAFAAWQGYDSPLRGVTTIGTCRDGGHRLWWTVDAEDPDAALGLLPGYLAQRTEVVRVTDVAIP